MNDTGNFNLGREFEVRLLKCLFEDEKVFFGIMKYIYPHMFSDEYLREIATHIRDIYDIARACPTYECMESMIKWWYEIAKYDAIKEQHILDALEEVKNNSFDRMDLIKKELFTFLCSYFSEDTKIKKIINKLK